MNMSVTIIVNKTYTISHDKGVKFGTISMSTLYELPCDL